MLLVLDLFIYFDILKQKGFIRILLYAHSVHASGFGLRKTHMKTQQQVTRLYTIKKGGDSNPPHWPINAGIKFS